MTDILQDPAAAADPVVAAKPARSPYAIAPHLAPRLARRVLSSPGADPIQCVTPFTGELLATLPGSTVDDVEVAYKTARRAQRKWAATSPRERARFLLKLHDLVLKNQGELMDLIQLESGKTRRNAFEEVMDVAGVARHYARRANHYLKPRRALGAVPVLTQTRVLHHPKGVVGVVAPWNYPLSMSITDALPALVAGNAIVLRPDSQSALTALRAVELIDQAGLPNGLLQVVLGPGSTVGQAVLDQADYVMFTGSTKTGIGVAQRAAGRLVGASMELGGKNAMYVAADANLNKAAEGAVRACFSSAGQLCISIERLVVHESVADEFTKLFVKKVQAMKLGSDLDWGNDMGSLISAAQLKTVVDHVTNAKAAGAVVLAGGKARPDLGPYFFEPTVLANVPDSATCRRCETFGPLVSIYRVASDEEAIAFANDSEYGLNASVWTKRVGRGRQIAARIKAGTVNINEGYVAAWGSNGAPMGGMGQSGLGRRHGAEGILKYTESQNIAAQHVMPIAPAFGVPEKLWAKTMSLGLRAMKLGRLS
ncbi:succinate-semialdehyde dehydrogenase/glutarate-semialdehyde dehydrogenase [Branchiibius hedensis]|uniref:succinate-semialdehyde dehydrogenase (NADP(+)) n=1 Tax=Branchiibius hedensis TaxID=672460 RepID=A0A2Y8ZSQ3_9MICO|nr:succinic semialdehyde dehydrogenase [Branchiibius hedensis]PWJ26182.1 succinate-semialdehyde dehydrogenase/glutarate-semialdehyde dehydrogenase [Branchiibius hedensis]SSA34994.1 succinate-semialdehyde dehydrogenase / glutarate-semialdehyde dehydrogenase [Branchiibius hedensis]